MFGKGKVWILQEGNIYTYLNLFGNSPNTIKHSCCTYIAPYTVRVEIFVVRKFHCTVSKQDFHNYIFADHLFQVFHGFCLLVS